MQEKTLWYSGISMASKKPLIAANWKMHPAPTGGGKSQNSRSKSQIPAYQSEKNVDVVVFPTFLDIPHCLKAGLTVGAQYGHPEVSGAHTGDISMAMVRELGCTYVLCGHSERRRDHAESNEFVAAQALAALKHGLHPILCIGETWEERKADRSKDVVKQQLEAVLSKFPSPKSQVPSPFTLAYEPVWAISGGDPTKPAATAADAQEMHVYIRSLLPKVPSPKSYVPILYGGSMKPENAEELLKQPDIDGGLVGNASLDPQKFQRIIEIAAKSSS